MEKKQIVKSALDCCVLLQEGRPEEAYALLPALQEELRAVSAEDALTALKNVLSTAIRKRHNYFFAYCLWEMKPLLLQLLTAEQRTEGLQEFMSFAAYTVCDRRLSAPRSVVMELVQAFVKNADEEGQRLFWNEWCSLAARFAQRKWQEQTDWLLQLMLRQLWRRREPRQLQQVMWQLQLHFTMLCRYEGFASAFVQYRKLFYAYLTAESFLHSKYVQEEQKGLWLQIILGAVRDLVTQAARIDMQEEQELYRMLYKQWLNDLNPDGGERSDMQEEDSLVHLSTYSRNEKSAARVQRFVQLVITYWSFTNPKSSRRQIPLLKDIMEPQRITSEDESALQALS